MSRHARAPIRFTGLFVAPITFLSLALATGLPAQATPQPASVAMSAAGHHTANHSAKPTTKSIDKNAKVSERHYKPAGCNKAQPHSRANLRARCFALIKTNAHGKIVSDASQPPATALGPADIQSAYDLPSTGQGETVAVIDAFGYSTAESDLAVYRSYYGLPPCTTANGCFRKVDEHGGTNYPPDDFGWADETALDLDAVSAACPNCHILLVEGNTNGLRSLGTAAQTAVSLGAEFVSNSYGVPGEFANEQSLDFYYDHPGVAVVASTGDDGGVTNWPASNPNVTAIGGTTLTRDAGTSRGWTETAWDSGGSGCSPYEPKPDYQDNVDTGCDNRAIADVSADADPATGLAIYISLTGEDWAQYGGTSLSSPLLAGMYALAGAPASGTYPVTYPYDRPGDFNDVTEGSDGTCGNQLCNAGPGWDGPTGLGTPSGVDGLGSGPHGLITGEVTDSSTGDPIADASVSTADGYSDTTDASGDYTLNVPVGTYDLTASSYGYNDGTSSGVHVTDGGTTTVNFALVAIPTHTVTGTIRDGSGAGWPLYASISVVGSSAPPVWTNPVTGRYSVELPEGDATLEASAYYPGYRQTSIPITVGTHDLNKNFNMFAMTTTCNAPGYSYHYSGTTESFTGWTGKHTQDGWTQQDNLGNGLVWDFNNPGDRTPPPGSDGDMAAEDSDHDGPGVSEDASLVSPVIDLSGISNPSIGFDTYYHGFFENQTGDVDLSIDGGSTWTNVWHQDVNDVIGHVTIPIPDAANQSDVQVRFHFTSSFGWWWLLDNVFVGSRTCVAGSGGLVLGHVRDANTGVPINGATVARQSHPGQFGGSVATPDDPNVGDGFYWLYSRHAGRNVLRATDGKYTPQAHEVDVVRHGVVTQSFALGAGHLVVSTNEITETARLGRSKSEAFTITNDGTAPVHVSLDERNGAFVPMAGAHASKRGAPIMHVKAHISFAARPGHRTARTALIRRQTTPSDGSWTSIADYPDAIMDNAVVYNDGVVYSFGGSDTSSVVSSAYAYDPSAQSWSSLAPMPADREAPTAGVVDGLAYVVGGWGDDGNASSNLYVYDPSSDSWSSGASLPEAVAGAAGAVLNGQFYVIGGCTTGDCPPTSNAVYSYDPSSDTWTQHADYPLNVTFLSCAGINSEVVCTGGVDADSGEAYASTYVYDPGSDTWSQAADLPIDDWGMASAGANGMLEVAGGATQQSANLTNQAFAYDPSADSWTALPNANTAVYRGGGSCGFYKVGGSTGGFSPVASSEVLPGFESCGISDVAWISESSSELTIAPGQTRHVLVTLDSSVLSQPGEYDGGLALSTDSPYQYAPVGITFHVTPPKPWGKIRGTVTQSQSGDPLAGATVQICTLFDPSTGNCGPTTYTLKTDNSGYYQLWLSKGYNPLEVIAAKDGYQPKLMVVRIRKGRTTTVNFSLPKS